MEQVEPTRSRVLLEQRIKRKPKGLGKLAEKFQLTIIAKDSVVIEDMINPPSRLKITYPIPETSEPSDDQTRRAEKEERNQ